MATALVMGFLTGIFGEGFDEIEGDSYRAAQARGVVQTIIVVSVLAAVGIMVLVILYGATDDVINNTTSGNDTTPLDGTLDSFFETIDSVWTLVAVALIMLVIGVVIAVLNRSM